MRSCSERTHKRSATPFTWATSTIDLGDSYVLLGVLLLLTWATRTLDLGCQKVYLIHKYYLLGYFLPQLVETIHLG